MSPELSPLTDPAAIYDISREDQLAEDNRGVIGYDPDPALKAQAAELQHQMHLEFLRTMERVAQRDMDGI